MTTTHPDYAILAARVAVSNLHKQTKKQFSAVITDLYNYVNPKNGKKAPMISDYTYSIVMKHADELNSAIVYDRDFNYQYFGFKTLERSYLLRIDGKVAERPQHMIMRVAVGIHKGLIYGARDGGPRTPGRSGNTGSVNSGGSSRRLTSKSCSQSSSPSLLREKNKPLHVI